ncbi:hypothetical protein ACQY0O_004989 [Thecaphora frezii]
MDARSSDDALPSTPPEPAGAHSPSDLPPPTRSQKQAEVRELLASSPDEDFDRFRTLLQDAFPALKQQTRDLDSISQRSITLCQDTIRQYFEFIVSELSQRGPNRLPDWLARRIFITPSQDQRPIIPANELFRLYRTWCTSNEEFDFYSALTELLILGLQAVPTVSKLVDDKKYATYARRFAADLHGDVVQDFNDALLCDYEAEFDPKSYDGRIIPIVQSNGTGKSRMVHEMRKIWPTLSVTLRTSADDPDGGFPIQDVAAVNYFRQKARIYDYDLITIAFLAAWFKVAAENIPENEPSTVEAIFDAKWGHSIVDEDLSFVHNPARQSMFDMVASDADLFVEDWRKNHSGNNVDSMVKQLLEQPLRQFAQRIASLEAVKRQTKEHGCEKPLVLIAFDECSLLSEFMPRYQLQHLRRCFHHIGMIEDLPVSVWLLLLDASSTIRTPRFKQNDRSLGEVELWHFLPFFASGFDVLEEKAIARHPRDALKLDTIKYYGRPLWHGYEVEKLLEVAHAKLGGAEASMSPGDPTKARLSEALAVSLLSNRICLDLLPLRYHQSGWKVVSTTVEHHMRIIVETDQFVRIGTEAPSEPMLAIAAWYWLSDTLSFPCSWPNVIEYMRDHLLRSESVDREGLNGETLIQLLFILARDSTDEACEVRKLPWRNKAPDMPAIPFPSFLSALLGKSASKLVLDKLQQLDTEAANVAPDQARGTKRKHPSAGIDVAEEEGQCWVNFTHVTPVAATAPQITSYFLWEAWKRGAAIQCAMGQTRIDGILPIYRGSLDDAFNEVGDAARRMTYMPWQVKNRDKGTKSTECMHGPLVALPAKETEEPMFTLLFELGTESAFQRDVMISEAHPKISVSSFECTQLSCRSRSKRQVVRVRGCEAKVYPCLEHWEAGDAFGDMVKQQKSISEGKTFFDGPLIYEFDDQLYKKRFDALAGSQGSQA